METGAKTLVDLIFRPENLALVVGVWSIISGMAKAFPKLAKRRVWARVQPLLAPALCIAAMLWLPGLKAAEGLSIGDRIVLGLVLGFAVGQVHKLIKQTWLGKDERIKPTILQ